MTPSYVFDQRRRIWLRPAATHGFKYSDGEVVEEHLLKALRGCNDIRCVSTELRRYVHDWPSEYHLSPTRHNLLRFLRIGPEHNILELGCGCGAMTRFLAESGANVTAVEGSVRRAQIAAERCRDLPNARIVCDNLMKFESDQHFDFVTLIGVLEYAPCYIPSEDPIVACLEQASLFLVPHGILILAIENQLGLKYFNGCAEDHLGLPYYGVHDLYRDNEPATFGRVELEKKHDMAGFSSRRFYYPFPDYKLPRVIFSEDAFSAPGFDAAALLGGLAARNASGEFHPNFHENLAWRPIVENELLPQLANSFLVLAARSEEAFLNLDADFLACVYTPERIPAFATETLFRYRGASIFVEKRRLHPDLRVPEATLPQGRLIHSTDSVQAYVAGRPYLLELQYSLGRSEDIDSVIAWAADWLDLLLTNSSVAEDGTATLPSEWLDAIPQNFIRSPAGSLHRIDDEWSLQGAVPRAWLIIRGLVNALAMSPTSTALGILSLQELIQRIAVSRGIVLDRTAFQDAVEQESALLSLVYGRATEEKWLGSCLQQPATSHLAALMHENSQRRIAGMESEISRIKSTVSWQITKPVRLLANLPRHFRTWLESLSSNDRHDR
ncbi:hypothetical protein CCR95_21355 [Thiocystis minor]|uniref:class I SAM-dependent methyltransferase n=1 Tax=Thiocystis minor TaxID=61597 RepID=UPI0019142091|nr:class I SAM-dependent methyltransferase [Thiocystis minor]MBK5966550.1 hypothetical protein [Thiocystis minor]